MHLQSPLLQSQHSRHTLVCNKPPHNLGLKTIIILLYSWLHGWEIWARLTEQLSCPTWHLLESLSGIWLMARLIWRVQDGFLYAWCLSGDIWNAGHSWAALSLSLSICSHDLSIRVIRILHDCLGLQKTKAKVSRPLMTYPWKSSIIISLQSSSYTYLQGPPNSRIGDNTGAWLLGGMVNTSHMLKSIIVVHSSTTAIGQHSLSLHCNHNLWGKDLLVVKSNAYCSVLALLAFSAELGPINH